MIKLLKNLVVIGLISGGLITLGIAINNTGIWAYLTTFFILFRTVVKPLSFMWDFGTTFQIIGLSITLMASVYTFKGIMTIKNFLE